MQSFTLQRGDTALITGATAGTGMSVSGSTGSVTFNATGTTINSQTTGYTLVAGDAGDLVEGYGTVNLPALSSFNAGQKFNFKNISSTANLTVVPNSGNLINTYTTGIGTLSTIVVKPKIGRAHV